jgi:hypothetical protein
MALWASIVSVVCQSVWGWASVGAPWALPIFVGAPWALRIFVPPPNHILVNSLTGHFRAISGGPFGKGVRIEENVERFFLPAGAPARCLKHENRVNSLMVPLPHLNENHFRSISGGPFAKGAPQVGARVPDFCFLGSGGNSQFLRLPKVQTFRQPKSLIGSAWRRSESFLFFFAPEDFFPTRPDI